MSWVSNVCLMVLLLILWLNTSFLKLYPNISIGYEPGMSTKIVDLQLAADATQGRVSLFVENRSSEPLRDVLLYAGNLRRVENGTAVDQPVAVGNLQFVDPVQNDVPLGRINFETPGAAHQVVLSITNFTAMGTFSGFIGIDVGQQKIRLASLTVTRLADPSLTIKEAGEGTTIRLTTFGAELNDTLLLSTSDHEHGLQDVTLEASGLHTSGGRNFTMTIDPAKLALGPNMTSRVSLRATVPETGEFTGDLFVTHGGQRKRYDLVVKRETSTDDVRLDAVSPAPVICWPWPLSYLQPCTATVRLNLTESKGRRMPLYEPNLERLVLVGVGEQRTDALYADYVVIPQPSATTEPTSIKAANGLTGITVAERTNSTTVLEPNQLMQKLIVVHGIRGAGLYQGTVTVATPGGTKATQTFALIVRHHWFFAALAIFLGAGASYWFRHWLDVGRVETVQALGIRHALDRIAEAIPDPRSHVRQGLELRLRRAWELYRLKSDTDVDLVIKDVTILLNSFLLIRDVINRINVDLDTLITDQKEKLSIHARVKKLEGLLAEGGVDVLANDGAAVKEAHALERTIIEGAHTNLRAGIAELERLVQDDQKALNSSKLSDLDKQELSKSLQEVLDTVGKAKNLVSPGMEEKSVAALRQTFEDAHQIYVEATDRHQTIKAQIFKKMLEAQTQPPIGIAADDWQKCKDLISKTFKEEGYAVAYPMYVRQLLEALERKARQDQNNAIADQAANALKLLDSDLKGATDIYTELVTQYRPPAATGGSAARVVAPIPTSEMIPGGTASREIAQITSSPSVSIPRSSELLKQDTWNKRYAFCIASIVTVAIGLQLLWANSANGFGSLADYIGAMLWGFGLHQLNSVALPAAATQVGMPLLPASVTSGTTAPPSQQTSPSNR